MVIDLFTGKEIPSDPVLTVTQSLVKSTDVLEERSIDYENPENNDWEEVLRVNKVLTPNAIINQFQAVLLNILKGQAIDPNYCEFMIEQCKDWEISDQFVITE